MFKKMSKKNGSGSKKGKKSLARYIELSRTKNRTIIIFLIIYFASISILISGYLSRSQNVVVGQPSPTTYTAKESLTYESSVLTEEERKKAVAAITPVMAVDQNALNVMEDNIYSVFVNIEADREAYAALADKESFDKFSELNYPLYQMSKEDALAILEAPENEIDNLKEYSLRFIRRFMGTGIQTDGIEIVRQNMLDEIAGSNFSETYKSFLNGVFTELELTETLYYDDEATKAKTEDARNSVKPVDVIVKQGDIIVREGQIVTPEIYEMLINVGISLRESVAVGIIGIALIVLALYLLLILFLSHYKRETFKQESNSILLGVLVLTAVVIIELFVGISSIFPYGHLIIYITPLAAVAMLSSILLDEEISLMLAIINSLILGVAAGLKIEYTIFALLSSYVSIFSVAKLSHRRDMMKSALFIMGTNILTILSISWLLNYKGINILYAVLLGAAGGFLSSITAIGFLPYFELIFKVTTPISLLEFSDPNQPLLRKLLTEAPGTYHHSILVSNLSEAAAEAVGADKILTRVGAYYHDIGKIRRPYFFIENQVGLDENPHEKLTPRLSTLIIASHVKDGLELAKEYRLPPTLQQFIASHHGTTLVGFFCKKAKEAEGKVDENDFRYEGPRPVSKEAAIVMLADTVEASVRSLKNASPGRIEGFVRKVIKDKFEDGQLAESNLTFRELEDIAKAFVKVLSGIYHKRIEYPEQVVKEMERKKEDNGTTDTE